MKLLLLVDVDMHWNDIQAKWIQEQNKYYHIDSTDFLLLTFVQLKHYKIRITCSSRYVKGKQ